MFTVSGDDNRKDTGLKVSEGSGCFCMQSCALAESSGKGGKQKSLVARKRRYFL